MNEELVRQPKMADLSPAYQEIMVIGNVLYQSGFFKDVRDQAQAVTKILFGKELGFTPIISMGGIHIIEGKPALSSNLMATLIKRSGKYDYRVKIWDNSKCVLMFRQKDKDQWEDVGESSFTMDDAKAAGVLKPNGSWAKYPKAMLFARALSQGLRTYCPDVSASPIYNPEEMGAEVNEEGEVTKLPKSAVQVERTTEDIPLKPPVKAEEPAKADPSPALPLIPTELPKGTIEDGQAVNFERLFKDALRPHLRKNAKDISHAWLKKQGIVDPAGNGTAKAILKDNFYQVREEAITYAVSVEQWP